MWWTPETINSWGSNKNEPLSLILSDSLRHTFTSVLLKAWKVLAVSGLALISGFLTSGSFTTGADVTEAGDGFCGGFWA